MWRDNQEREFHSQMSQIEGMVIGLEAGEGGRHVVYHFSLGGNEDVTRIHTKKQSCPCCFVHIPGVVLFFGLHASLAASEARFLSLASVTARTHSFSRMTLPAPLVTVW